MSKQTELKAAQAESIATLRKILTPGDTVTVINRSVAKSGMSRRITLLVAVEGEVRDITWDVARALGESVKQRGEYVQDAGLLVNGCGMDMHFATVYNLGRVMWPEGFKVDGYGRNGDESGWDKDGGYALKSRSL